MIWTAGALVALAVAALAASGGAATHAAATARPDLARPVLARHLVNPIPTSACKTSLGIECYSPGQFAQAYRLSELEAAGVDGSGETIAIVDSFGSPTIANDLHVFDQQFSNPPAGIPADPAIATDPNLTIITP
ncbi:MAG TPA: hypothetical protein VG265_10990, partial [Gaiellaceae bacterium]|nr:hypothetical protein [Gaiellaceae bacterium]